MTVRARQVLISAAGAIVTLALLALGLWQMRVYEDREAYNAEARAALPAVQLIDYVPLDGTLGDIYGKRATVTGHYLPDQQVHIIDANGCIAAHTGTECIGWHGHVAGDGFSIAGNMLAGADVLDQTASAYQAGKALPFPRRLVAAMLAGEAAGGDNGE